MPATRDELDLLILMARQRTDPSDARAPALCRGGGIDWERFYRLAEAERIAPLVHRNLLRCPGSAGVVPEGVLGKFAWSRRWTAAVKAARAAKTAEIARRLDPYSIRVMLLKGAALDRVVYDEPWFTSSEDVDLMVDRRHGDMPPEALEGLIGDAPGFELEFGRHHDLDMNGVLDLDYDRLWRVARPLTVEGGRVWVMSPEDLLIASCTNLCRKRFARLKEVCAVAEILSLLTPGAAARWTDP